MIGDLAKRKDRKPHTLKHLKPSSSQDHKQHKTAKAPKAPNSPKKPPSGKIEARRNFRDQAGVVPVAGAALGEPCLRDPSGLCLLWIIRF